MYDRKWKDDKWEYQITRSLQYGGSFYGAPDLQTYSMTELKLTRLEDGSFLCSFYRGEDRLKEETYIPKFEELKKHISAGLFTTVKKQDMRDWCAKVHPSKDWDITFTDISNEGQIPSYKGDVLTIVTVTYGDDELKEIILPDAMADEQTGKLINGMISKIEPNKVAS